MMNFFTLSISRGITLMPENAKVNIVLQPVRRNGGRNESL